MSATSEKQLIAQLSAQQRKQKRGPRSFALRYEGSWSGHSSLQLNGIEYLIRFCESDLAAREALVASESCSMPVALLCRSGSEMLGEDVINRLDGRRVHATQMADTVAELFSVTSDRVDYRIRRSVPLMKALLEYAPPSGYAPATSGSLDLETAWFAVLNRVLGKDVKALDLTIFLRWMGEQDTVEKLMDSNGDLRERLTDWLISSRSRAFRPVMKAVESGFGRDLLALGAVLGLVFHNESSHRQDHQIARGRMERFFQNESIDEESARSWFQAAEPVLRELANHQDREYRRHTWQRIDQIAADIGLENHLGLSPFSESGLEKRFELAGESLLKSLNHISSSSIQKSMESLEQVRNHSLSPLNPDRLSRIEMAIRVLQWLAVSGGACPLTHDGDLASQSQSYFKTGGFLDWARHRLKESDQSRKVQKAFDAILARLDEALSQAEKNFALQLKLANETDSCGDGIILIENFIQEALVPIARDSQVLLLVLDGMSAAVFRQLISDMTRHQWTELARPDSDLPRPVLATLPSVTGISRRALFLGRLDPATNGTEEGEFRMNQSLQQECRSAVAPQLFKAADLSDESEGSGIPERIRNAIGNSRCRVVSVIINAIDDNLSGAKQLNTNWTFDNVKGLRAIFHEAASAGRVIVLTSDHGHILDFGTELAATGNSDERGDRFRPSTGTFQDGELDFSGPRIKKATGKKSITVAASSRIRYAKDKKGYHGGATPQEMVIPLAYLSFCRNKPPKGWIEVASFEPDWWTPGSNDQKLPAEVKTRNQAVDDSVRGLELFELTSDPATSDSRSSWIDEFIACPIYTDLRAQIPRAAPDEKMLREFLSIMDQKGNTVMKQTLAAQLSLPLFRIDGLIEKICRLMNLDGYEVVSFDRHSDTVRLDRDLMRSQFDLRRISR